jgi:hypothetical protein
MIRHRRRSAAAAAVTVFGALLLAAVTPVHAVAVTPTVLYVSPSGSGSACSISAPCSLDVAKSEVESLAPSMSADLDVTLRGGTYQLSSTFSLGTTDSGRNGHKVVWQAYPGEKPVLSGAQKVTGWSLYDSSKNIYRASVPTGTHSRQLFVNGVRAQRARGALNPAGFSLSGSSFVTSDSSYTSFTNQSSVEIVDDNEWKQMRCPLASITSTSSGGSSLNVDSSCFSSNNTSVPNPGFPFNGNGVLKLGGISWIENAYQLLSTAGQFYLDSSAGQLYYIPRSGENLGTADVELPTTQELVDVSGTPGHLAPVNDTDANAAYTGSWSRSTGRPYGDFGDDVHVTTTNGDSVSYTFTGTGLDVLSEVYSDEGAVDVYVDGAKTQSVSATVSTRLAQQAIVSVTGLSKGTHTVKLVKTSGTYLLIDGFTVVPDTVSPVHDITFQGITFAYATWNQPSASGYVDNQAGVLWDPTTHAPMKIPAAVQVHRGNNIDFTGDEVGHTGGTGIDLADGTQNSAVTGDWIHDTSGGGVSVGEVDDYYLTDTGLMTSGDTVSENWIDHVGQDYADAVGVWAGYTRNTTLSHNDVGHTPYSGMSLGWGWAWASDCALYNQQKGSASGTPCRRGNDYAGGNQILDNHVHDVMGILHDGAPIYTLGGQGGGDATMTSVLSGNLLEEENTANNLIYHDEGSSYWNTHDNVTRYGGSQWIGIWTPTIHDINVHDNYSDNAKYQNNGTSITFNQATIVSGGAWPGAAQSTVTAAGPDAAYQPLTGRLDDDGGAVTYTGSWWASETRGMGDFNDGLHATGTNGDSASLTFIGTGIKVIGEKNSDQGNVEIYLDGSDQGAVSTSAAGRQVQQVLYSVQGLTPGTHTVKVVKNSGSYATLDSFEVTGTYNDTTTAISYTGASWGYSSSRGLGDYGDDVHAATANGDSVTVPFYGTGITFIGETNSDEGTIDVSLDGAPQGSVDANAASRHAQQAIYQVSGLPVGWHQLTLTKTGGTYMVVDRFDVG